MKTESGCLRAAIWYTEIWTEEDFESALESINVPATEDNVKTLKNACLKLFYTNQREMK